MNIKFTSLALAACCLLTACGDSKIGSIGASVDRSKTDSINKTTSVSEDQKVDSSSKTAKSVTMPAAILVARAARTLSNQYKSTLAPAQISKAGAVTLAGLVSKGSQAADDTFAGAAAVLNAAFTPIGGWRSDQKDSDYARGLYSIVSFANDISCELITKVESESISDPSKAMLLLSDALYSIPPATLEMIWASKQAEVRGMNLVLNMAGSTPNVQFYAGGKTINGSTMGVSLDGDGVALFGDGKACGRTVTLSMDTSLSTDLSLKKSIDKKISNTTAESVKVDAGVKN